MMKQSFRRLAAVLLSGALILSLSACGGSDDSGDGSNSSTPKENPAASELAMTVNGHEVETGLYAASYLYGKYNVESMMTQYGISDPWNSEDGDTYKEQLNDVAYNQTVALFAVADQFEAAGLTLTDEDRGDISTAREQLKDFGFTEDLTRQFSDYYTMLDKLDVYYFGEGGTMAPEEAEIEEYYQQNYMRAKHVLISTRDESQQDITDEDTLADLEAKAKDIAQRARGGEDFDSLVSEYSEDPGSSANPDGYLFTSGEMITEFEDGVKALEINEISEPVKSIYGWHIIQRLPLRDEDRSSVFSNIVQAITGMDMNSLLTQWINEAEVTKEPVMDQITFDTVDDYKYSVE